MELHISRNFENLMPAILSYHYVPRYSNNCYQINNNIIFIILSYADFKFESLANRDYLKFEQKYRLQKSRTEPQIPNNV